MSRYSLIAVFGVTFGASLGGCAWLHPVDHDVAPPVLVPEQFSQGTATSSVGTGRWWTALSDPTLDRLEAQAFEHNLDLLRAFLRVDAAVATAAAANAAWWPSLDAEVNASRTRSVTDLNNSPFAPGGGGEPNIIGIEQSALTLSLAAAYEIDVFGKLKSRTSATDFDALATRHDLDAVAMSLSAQVAEVWYQLVEQRAVLALLDQQIESNGIYLELTELRFGEGQATALDVLQQRQQTAATRSQRPLVEARVATLEHQLAILLGAPPRHPSFAEVTAFPELPPLPETGVPAALVRRRPDVRAAELRVVAADYRVGAALADRFPSLRLNGSLGLRVFSLSTFFDGVIWNVAGSLLGPIFDGGRRAAEMDRTEAVLQEALTTYGQTVLVAFREVEDALVQERKQREHLEQLAQQVEAARRTLDEARTRYLGGLSEYLQVLTALRTLQQVEQQYLTSQRQLLSYRIQLCRSLGGDWMRDLERPTFLSAAEETPPEALP